MVHMNTGFRGMALSFVLVIIDAIDIHYADIVVTVLHAICTSTASEHSMTLLSLNSSSLLARALQTLHIDLVKMFE